MVKYKVGDKVRIKSTKDNHGFFEVGEICQVIEVRGANSMAKLLLQSYRPTFGEGLWLAWARDVEPFNDSKRLIVFPGDIVKIDYENCVVAKIDDFVTLVSLRSGLNMCPLIPYQHPIIIDELKDAVFKKEKDGLHS